MFSSCESCSIVFFNGRIADGSFFIASSNALSMSMTTGISTAIFLFLLDYV